MKKQLLLSGIILAANMLLLQSPAQARSSVLQDPELVEFDCKLTMKQAKKAIISGLRGRQWTHKVKKPGLIGGRILVRGKHTLWVDIKYTRTSFDIDYRGSDNLNYHVKDNGVKYLHPNANSWMNNLKNDIRNAAYDMCP